MQIVKARRHMATVTLLTEISMVHIIAPMTDGAAAGNLWRRSGPMARLADQSFVGAVQHKLCGAVMVETPQLPAVWCMTCIALLAQRAFVLVVLAMAAVAGHWGIAIHGGHMACLARRRCVQADERETGDVMLEQHVLGPALFVMAPLAGCAEFAAVGIVILMTGAASAFQRHLMYRTFVTTIAVEFFVRALQRIAAGSQMIEFRLLPIFGVMTVAAGRAIAAFMHVIGAVTTDTVVRRLVLGLDCLVTGIARELLVFEQQRKFSLAIVFEPTLFPCLVRVAVTALFTEATTMYVVQPMTGRTGHGRIFETGIRMTRITSDFGVFVVQRELGFVVIILGILAPADRLVAVAAFVAQVSLVRILLAMALDTCRRRVTVFLAGHVTGATACRRVRAQQGKVRCFVIKAFRNQQNNVGAAPLVVGMAALALQGLVGRAPAVKAGASINVGGDLLVTGETQTPL